MIILPVCPYGVHIPASVWLVESACTAGHSVWLRLFPSGLLGGTLPLSQPSHCNNQHWFIRHWVKTLLLQSTLCECDWANQRGLVRVIGDFIQHARTAVLHETAIANSQCDFSSNIICDFSRICHRVAGPWVFHVWQMQRFSVDTISQIITVSTVSTIVTEGWKNFS